MERFSSGIISVAQAAGSIENATPLTSVLLNALQFLLSIAGVVGIIGVVISGVWYLTAGGDEHRLRGAKRAAFACIVGLIIVVGALVVVTQIAKWFS